MKIEENKYNSSVYQQTSQMVIGFHGCDRCLAERILNSQKEHLTESINTYDWLGNGIYFWLNDPQRAYEWACETHIRNPKKVKEPYVIGAIINLGLCLNFSERSSVMLLQKSYKLLKESFNKLGLDINDELVNKVPDKGGFNLIRPLDCAVIQNLHKMLEKENISFDTVYGYFQEGKDAFCGGGIKEKSHIQVCVRNPLCIKGYFLPREK